MPNLERHFSIAPKMEHKDKLIPSGDWSFKVNPRVGDNLTQLPQEISEMEGYHPGLHAVVKFDKGSGFKIIEGYHPDKPEGRMGVSIFGSTFGIKGMGYSILPYTEKTNGEPQILMSLIEQTRNTVNTESRMPQIIRGFAEPDLTDAQVAVLEGEEEGGVSTSVSRWVTELGVPINTNHDLMKTDVGGGINIFKINFPATLLEEVKDMTQNQKKRWKLDELFMSAEAKDKAFEGVGHSMFIRIKEEIVNQEVWTGACDMMTIVGAARLLEDTCKLDFSGFWNRLPRSKKFDQTREAYPISTLDPNNYDSLIGKGPKWQWTFNGKHDLVVPVGSIWAVNNTTGQEFAFGHRKEATDFDGSVWALPEAVYLPVIEVDGKLFVGGKHQNLKNIGEHKPFVAGSTSVNPETFSIDELIPSLENDIGISNIPRKGILKDDFRQIIVCNRNSAHEVEGLMGFVVPVGNPDLLEKSTDGKFRFKNGDPNFVFIPVSEAINSPDGNTAALASALYSTANFISVKK